MIWGLVVALVTPAENTSVTTRPEVAYIARYYFPGKKKSHYHVYLSDLLGNSRRQISRDPAFRGGLYWSSRSKVVWQASEVRWNVYDLATGRLRQVAKPPQRGKSTESPKVELLGQSTNTIQMRSGKVIEWAEEYPTWLRVGTTKMDILDPQERNAAPIRTIYPTANENVLYAATAMTSANGAEDSWTLHRIDWKSGRCRVLQKELRDIFVDPSRDLFLALRSRNWEWNLADLGDGRFVWVSRLNVGRLSTNRMWPIVDGLADPWAFALRPK